MTVCCLIRHGAHNLGGERLAGRTPGVHLSALGRNQVDRLAARLSRTQVHAIYASPIDRTRETADILAAQFGLNVELLDALAEVDFGDWTGADLRELRQLPRFQQWNSFRSGSRIPGGEAMLETQARMVAAMLTLCERHNNELIVLVSHGDVIKAAVAYFLGVPLDLFLRIEISLASLSAVGIGTGGAWVLCVNHTGDDLPLPSELDPQSAG